jgi:hypothetical protein
MIAWASRPERKGHVALVERTGCLKRGEALGIKVGQLQPAVACGLGHGPVGSRHLLVGAAAIVTDVGFHGRPSPRSLISESQRRV